MHAGAAQVREGAVGDVALLGDHGGEHGAHLVRDRVRVRVRGRGRVRLGVRIVVVVEVEVRVRARVRVRNRVRVRVRGTPPHGERPCRPLCPWPRVPPG